MSGKQQKGGMAAAMLLAAQLIIGATGTPAMAAQGKCEQLNLSLLTMGGKQFWSDIEYRDGWRIQRNSVTGHVRLLDPANIRQGWGSYSACRELLNSIVPEKDAGRAGKPLAILLHGVLRSGGSFARLEKRLEREGYEVAALSYASTRGDLQQHARNLNGLLDNLPQRGEVVFVTHSMGALVLRTALAARAGSVSGPEIGRIVMIGPPNRGAWIAGKMRGNALYRWVYGPAGQQLPADAAAGLPVPEMELGIIAGGSGTQAGYNPFVPGDDDGVVAVSETRLQGMADFKCINALHGTLLSREETAEAVIAFLRNGKFNH